MLTDFIELQSDRVSQWDYQQSSVSVQALLIGVIIAVTIASAGGFFVGYRISGWRSLHDPRHSSGSSSGLYFILDFSL